VAGNKPDLSVSFKPAGGGKEDRIYAFAGWKNEHGRISSLSIDRRVVGMKFKLDDGTVVTIQKDRQGRWSHYVDVFLRDGTYGQDRGGEGRYDRNDPAFGGDDGFGPDDDFGGDNLPDSW